MSFFLITCTQVYKAKEVKTDRTFAIKMCEKLHIRQEKMRDAIMREKEIMTILTNHSNPFLIRLYCSFQDETRLCNMTKLFVRSEINFFFNFCLFNRFRNELCREWRIIKAFKQSWFIR